MKLLPLFMLVYGLASCRADEQKQVSTEYLIHLRNHDQDSFLLMANSMLKKKDMKATELSDVHTQLGHYYFNLSENDSAYYHYQNARTIRKNTGDTELMLNSQASQAEVLAQKGETEKAIAFYKETMLQRTDKDNLCDDYTNMAALLANKNLYHEATPYFLNAISLAAEIKDNYKLGRNYYNFSMANCSMGKFDSAQYYLKKSRDIPEYASDGNRINFLLAEASIDYDRGDFEHALIMYDSSLALTYQKNLRSDRLLILEAKSYLAEMSNKQDMAIRLLKWRYNLSDSLFSANIQETIANLEVKFNMEGKANENRMLQLENRQKTLILWFLGSGLGLLLFTGLIYYRHSRHKLKLKSSQLLNFLQSHELNMINATLSGQEKERKKIAQELHDGVGSNLARIKMQYSLLENSVNTHRIDDPGTYGEISSMIDETLKDIRRISHDMYGSSIIHLGLSQATLKLASMIEKTYSIQVKLHILQVTPMNYEVEINVYRIIQELLSNSLKYSGADRIDIQFIGEEKHLYVGYEDNGKGFNESTINSGLGLLSLKNRILALKGSYQIESAEHRGMQFLANIPYP